MSKFANGDVRIAHFDVGQRDGFTVLMIHSFASTAHVNWVFPGWVRTLTDAGYRVIAIDNRGHGDSDKPHDPAFYTPPLMAGNSRALLDHLNVDWAGLIGYSMGARLCAFFGLADRQAARAIMFGGLGSGMTDGVGDWDTIAERCWRHRSMTSSTNVEECSGHLPTRPNPTSEP